MNAPSREELIELGVSLPIRPLIAWARKQLAAAKGRESRLQSRGLSTTDLADIQDLAAALEKRHAEGGAADESLPQPIALAQRLYDEASGYRREIHRIAVLGFAARPDQLAAFRPGIRTGLLLGNLIRELGLLMPLLREHAAALAMLGVTPSFLERGAALLTRLQEGKRQLDTACLGLPEPTGRQCHDKGLLYDRTRRLVRIGRLEFMRDPDQAGAFGFAGVSRERGVSTAPRLKVESSGN